MRNIALTLAAALTLVVVTGCGGDGKDKASNTTGASGKQTAQDSNNDKSAGSAAKGKNGGQQNKGKKPRHRGTIGVSLLTLQNPFFGVIGENITREAAKYGYDTIVVSGDEDVAKQSNQVKDFIVKRVAAIVLSPCDSKSIVPVIQEANNAGIPVFTVDIPCNEKGAKIVSQIATDNYQGGKLAGDAMIEALGEAGGEVAILHFKQAESCLLRVKGFTEVIDKHNKTDKAKINVVKILDGGGSKDKGYKAADDAITSNPGLRGIFAINDPSALGARRALEKQGKADQVKIIGFDGQPEGKQAIKDGKIYADPIQFPDVMGVRIVETFVAHSKGQDVPPQVLIEARLYRKADGEKDPSLK